MIDLAVVCFYDSFYFIFFFNFTLRVVPSHLNISQIEAGILGEKMLLVLECDVCPQPLEAPNDKAESIQNP